MTPDTAPIDTARSVDSPGVVRWCRYEKQARERSPFAVGRRWDSEGIGIIHAVGTVIAVVIVTAALLGHLAPNTVRPTRSFLSFGVILLAGSGLAWWFMTQYPGHFPPGTPTGPGSDHRVQCSASIKVRRKLGEIAVDALEPEIYGVWFADAARASGKIVTTVAALLGMAGMGVVNWMTFGDPFSHAFVTLGLAGPAIGVAVLGVVFPVEWNFAPGTMEIVRPGFLGLGWRARTERIDLWSSRLFVDADARKASILTSGRLLRLRWDLALHRDEITRAILLAAVSTPSRSGHTDGDARE